MNGLKLWLFDNTVSEFWAYIHRACAETAIKELPVKNLIPPFAPATSISYKTDEIAFRKNLEMLYNWSKAWQLPISINKCQHFTIGRRKSKTTTAEIAFSIDDTVLPAPTLVNDLGILIDSGLTLSSQIGPRNGSFFGNLRVQI